MNTEIIELRAKGHGVADICRLLDVKRHIVRSVLDPAYRNPRAYASVNRPLDIDEPDDIDLEIPKALRDRAVMSEGAKQHDPNATREDCVDDLRSIQGLYPNRFITRWHYMLDGAYSESTWTRYCGNFKEFKSQAGL